MNIEILSGKTLSKVRVWKHSIFFTLTTGEKYVMYHEQDCCESVTVEDVCGDVLDLVGNPILLAEEVVKESFSNEHQESETWTFYKLSTVKGSVTIRWYGTSNGYYSERVTFEPLRMKTFSNWVKYKDHHIRSYCRHLGSMSIQNKIYDFGVYEAPNGEVFHAIVYGPEDFQYISGEMRSGQNLLCKINARLYAEYLRNK